MASKRSSSKINLDDIRANPDKIYDLLDDIDSDFEFENEDDDEWQPILEPTCPTYESENSDSDDDNSINENVASTSNASNPIVKKHGNKNKKCHKREQSFTWEKRPFRQVDVSNEAVEDIGQVLSPFQYFDKYLPQAFFDLAAVRTNQYYVHKNGNLLKPHVTSEEIKKFFGMHAVLGCIKYPRIRMYWQSNFRLPVVADTMSRNRFFTLRTNFHVEDENRVPNENKKKNKLWKVQPMIDFIRKRCREIERPPGNYSIDEQMIPFLGRCELKQYVKNKPRPVGLKNFVMIRQVL
uniref:PiggyBac transposable element-derived protein 3-like n=1 Tax=Diabrotica virgifera virgifera TaxID=50390 RepID=A0A6P7FSU9_DIAVI